MTDHVLDVASYQGALRIEDAARAGFVGVNLKTSHGLGRKSVHPDVAGWAVAARARRMWLSSFHFLTGEAPGREQAEYAYSQLVLLGLTHGAVHQVDCESDATLPILREYVTTMQRLLGRHVAVYSGRWWWAPRGWDITDLTPYFWSSPTAGYLGVYPGDTSPHWAGYGGWPHLSIMQYAVGPLSYPDGTTSGTLKVSKSAIRDPEVWATLAGTENSMTFAPQSILNVRHEFQRYTDLPNVALGIVRNERDTSYHVGKSWVLPGAYSISESSRDSKGLSEASSAIDIGYYSITVGGKVHTLRTFSIWLVGQCAAGAPDTKDIREVIYSPDGKVVKRWDRLGKRSSGDTSHLSHTHVSWFRDSENHDRAAVFRRYFAEAVEGADMPINDADVTKIFNTDTVIPNRGWAGDAGTNPSVTAATSMVRTLDEAHRAAEASQTVLTELRLMNTAVLKAIAGVNEEAVLAAVREEGTTIRREQAADAARDAATATAVQKAVAELEAIRATLEQSGGDPDLAPVLSRLDALPGLIRTSATSALARVAAAQEAEAAALREDS